MLPFTIALIQMDCVFGDVPANLARAEQHIRTAARGGAQLVCLPECFNTGYDLHRYPAMTALAESRDGVTARRISHLARELSVHILAPIPVRREDGRVENSALLFDDAGALLGRYAKTHLVGDEGQHMVPGEDLPVFDTKLGKLGVLICYDLCFPQTAARLALCGAEVLLCPAAWRDTPFFRRWLDLDCAARALDNTVYLAMVNRVGWASGQLFCGRSQVLSPDGEVLARLTNRREHPLLCHLSPERLARARAENPILEELM